MWWKECTASPDLSVSHTHNWKLSVFPKTKKIKIPIWIIPTYGLKLEQIESTRDSYLSNGSPRDPKLPTTITIVSFHFHSQLLATLLRPGYLPGPTLWSNWQSILMSSWHKHILRQVASPDLTSLDLNATGKYFCPIYIRQELNATDAILIRLYFCIVILYLLTHQNLTSTMGLINISKENIITRMKSRGHKINH